MLHATIDSILDASTTDALRSSSRASCEILDPGASSVCPVPLTPARNLTPEQAAELKELLLNPQSWFFAAKRCLPRETARFRLHSDEGEVSVSVGMACLDWTVTGPAGRWGGFFDPVQDQIRELLKSLFPEYASSARRSLWRSGIIARLRATGAGVEDRG
jgi:hypothetical protein